MEELKKVAVGTVTTLLLENIPFMQRPSADVTAFIRKCFPNLQMLVGGLELEICVLTCVYMYIYMKSCVIWIPLQNSQQLPKPVKFDLPIQSGEMPSIKVYVELCNLQNMLLVGISLLATPCILYVLA